ncbi:MAG TPA: DUF1549 domain-containing protein [Bryobacteraceae bacterium]
MKLCYPILALFCALARAQTAPPPSPPGEGELIFQKVVGPALRQKCGTCHGASLQSSGLRLDSREALLKGGSRGPAISPGDADHSLLLAAIAQTGALKMPPGSKVPDQTVASVRRWIELGAPWSNEQPKTDASGDATWAFHPLSHPQLPEGDSHLGPVDRFIQQKLAEKHLVAAGRADRRTLIRRATYDLWGLPPSLPDVEAFVKDPAPDRDAFAKLVDRLLASPHYGERWGRHWLDVVRYADTGGFSNDFERPNAWRYRDYVIRSFNQDKPFAQFVREQIAGDELAPDSAEAKIATGFLRMGPWEHTGMSVAAVTRQEWLDDVTHSTSATFLGVTMECARCHDHKFDPLPTRDYYRVQAVFATTEFADRPAPFLPGEIKPDFPQGRQLMADLQKRVDAKIAKFSQLTLTRLAKQMGLSGPEAIPEARAKEASKRQELLTPEEFERYKIFNKSKELYARAASRYEPVAYGVKDGKSLPETHILPVGNLQTPGALVTPGVPGAAIVKASLRTEVPQGGENRRLALAQWLANPDNPLTVRVIVNRIWGWHFGHGIVATPNDFGKLGKRPTHPELLDWLCGYFIDHGWSIKEMHRLIMLSDAYQMASTPVKGGVGDTDPDGAWLTYFPPRRLDAEEILDTMLADSGELSPDTGGPGTFPEINLDVANQPQQIMGTLMPAYRPSPTRAERNRRMIYAYQKRNQPNPMLDVLNGPSFNESVPTRDATTIPTQAFAMLNSTFANHRALALAAHASTVQQTFQLALGHAPDSRELRLASDFLRRREAFYSQHPAPPEAPAKPLVRSITSELTGTAVQVEEDTIPVAYEDDLKPSQVSAHIRALADLALGLFNTNEFAYVY